MQKGNFTGRTLKCSVQRNDVTVMIATKSTTVDVIVNWSLGKLDSHMDVERWLQIFWIGTRGHKILCWV